MALTSQKNDHQQTLGRGGEGEVLGEVIALARKVEEYRATLEQMDQHVGMLYLREVMQKGSQVREICNGGGGEGRGFQGMQKELLGREGGRGGERCGRSGGRGREEEMGGGGKRR